MRAEERKYTVYIADDGKEFKTEEACVNYENFNLETKLRDEVAITISKRDMVLARINYTKANKYGLLPWVTKKIKKAKKIASTFCLKILRMLKGLREQIGMLIYLLNLWIFSSLNKNKKICRLILKQTESH